MGLFDGFKDSIKNDNLTGWIGETLSEFELLIVKLLGRDGKILRNVYVPKSDGGTSEIDVVYITQKGIFVLESKNYSGWIFGDERETYWTATLNNRQKNRFYNPIMQNNVHVKSLKNYLLPLDVPMFSIIVFSDRCTLKKITITSGTPVIRREYLFATVRNIWDNNPDILTKQDVYKIWDKLKALTNVEKEIKDIHVDNIKKKYKGNKSPVIEKTHISENKKKQASAKIIPFDRNAREIMIERELLELKEEVEAERNKRIVQNYMICPRCGGRLVLRVAKKGTNYGKAFYGCEKFPRCRYVTKA